MKTDNQNKFRRRTPWDNFERAEMQDFIRTTHMQLYAQKHSKLADSNEAELLNSITVEKCRRCSSGDVKRNGYTSNGIAKYYCKECRKNFTVTTGTVFQDHKISLKEWIEYLRNLFGYLSLTADSWNNRNAFTTSKYWFKKTSIVCAGYQEQFTLKSPIYLDETYISVIKSDIVTNDGKKLRGISRNQICIGTATDGEHTIIKILGYGKPTQIAVRDAFIQFISRNSLLIHDRERAHRKLIKELELMEEVYSSKELKKLEDKDNPLDPVNRVHALLKKFFKAHSGFNRAELQDYLHVFSFMLNTPDDALQKIEIMLTWALRNPHTLKYRAYYKRKSVK